MKRHEMESVIGDALTGGAAEYWQGLARQDRSDIVDVGQIDGLDEAVRCITEGRRALSEASFSALVGRTLSKVEHPDNERVIFACTDGSEFHAYHLQNCCENVVLHDILGDESSILGNAITEVEEITSDVDPEDVPPADLHHDDSSFGASFTWTFHRIKTERGEVTFRWLGESNGYYGEEVYFQQMA